VRGIARQNPGSRLSPRHGFVTVQDMAITVSVAGGPPAWRRGMGSILEEGGFRPALLDDIGAWAPGVGGGAAFIHISDDSNLDSVEAFTEEYPHVPVIGVRRDLDPVLFAAGIRSGAIGMIDADDSPELVLLVLGAALRGLSVLPELVVRTMSQHTPDETDVSHWLNTDEMKWLVAMAAGSTVADLAESIGYSERAMFRRLKDLYQRLGVANRTEALLWAGRHGLLVSK